MIKATKNGSEVSKHIANMQVALRSTGHPTRVDEIFEELRIKLQGKTEPKDALEDFMKYLDTQLNTSTIKKIHTLTMESNGNKEPKSLFDLIAMLRAQNKFNLQTLRNMYFIYPGLVQGSVKREREVTHTGDTNVKQRFKMQKRRHRCR